MLTLNAADLSSYAWECSSSSPCTRRARPFNFADLEGPVPASAYFGDVTSDGGGLEQGEFFNGRLQTTIVEGNYWPKVLLPKKISSLAPDLFATCSIRFNFTELQPVREGNAEGLGNDCRGGVRYDVGSTARNRASHGNRTASYFPHASLYIDDLSSDTNFWRASLSTK